MDILTAIGDFINNTKSKISELAVKTNFKIRESKINPETFVMTMTAGQTEIHEITLDTLSGKMEELQEGLRITKQALHERLPKGALLMNEVFKLAFNDVSKKYIHLEAIEVLKQFKDIKINDGSTISLPNKLKYLYKGLGGTNADSAIKIQATYSVFQNEFVGLDFYSATKNDNTYNEVTLAALEAGELMIKDLGYYDGDYFKNIDSKQAFFLSRIKTNCVLYKKNHGEYEIVDIAKFLNTSLNSIDDNVFIKLSSGEMYGVRLTGIKLPAKISNERKRKAYKNAQSNQKQLTEKEIQLLDWFLLITNVSDDMLTINTIGELYRLRWQIELQFKALKSSMDFDIYGNMGENYFKCIFYGKLIMVILTMRLFAICRVIKYKETKRFISIQKFIRNLRNITKQIVNAMLHPTNNKFRKLESIVLRIASRSLFDKRRRQQTEVGLKEHDLPENVITMLIAENF
jgi:hypothetical protein